MNTTKYKFREMVVVDKVIVSLVVTYAITLTVALAILLVPMFTYNEPESVNVCINTHLSLHKFTSETICGTRVSEKMKIQ
jgi:hypothetical protein